jgi:prevent-host-death family protein
MATRQPVNETLNSTEARAHWGRVLGEVQRGGKRVVIERDGVPVAAIISADELRRFEQWERYQRQAKTAFFEAVDRLQELNRDADPEEIERLIAGAVEEVRRERQLK